MTTRTDRLQVIFEVGGDGKLKATLGDIGKQGERAAEGLDKTDAAYQRLQASAKAAGAVLGTALVGAIGLVIKNTMEAEAVSAQLDARLKSTAGAAGMTREAIDALAEATARKTTYDDDAIKSLSSMLLTFTRVHSDVFPRATAAITDMATAMGTDLQSATIQVGKALNDPIKGVAALSRVGVQFTEDQKSVIEQLVDTGRVAEAQGVILKELETQFGGSAKAARETFGGAIAALKNSLMDLTEGGPGSLEKARQGVEALNTTLQDRRTKEGVDELIRALLSLAGVAAEIPAGFALMGKFIGITLAEIANQAQATATLLKNVYSFGMADGSIKGALAQSAAGRKQYRLAIDDLALGNHGMTREEYNARAASSFLDLGLPGVDRAPVLPQSGFNFAADMAARGRQPLPDPKPDGSGKKGGAGRKKAAPKLKDFREEDRRELERLVKEVARADEEFARLAATLAGPLAAAEYEHQQNLREIDALGKTAGRTTQEILDLKEAEAARYRDEARAIEERMDPAAQLLRDLQFELELLGMTNVERATAIDLRRLEGKATEEQAAAIRTLHERLEATSRQQAQSIQMMDRFRDGAADALTDFVTGAKSAGDALRDFFDDMAAMITRAIAQRWMEQLFGAPGTGGTGGTGTQGGDLIGALLGKLFGGGRAQGGGTRRGRYYEVAEHGRPELYREAGRSWLIPGGSGQVQPLRAGGTMGGERGPTNFTQYINVPRGTSYRTAQQVGQEAFAAAQRATVRNR